MCAILFLHILTLLDYDYDYKNVVYDKTWNMHYACRM